MIEVAFTESAAGSLKMAQTYGQGEFQAGPVGIIVSHEDGSRPSREEIQEAERRYLEQARKDWEEAVPLGGRTRDVYCLPLGLSLGDLRQDPFGEERAGFLQAMIGIEDEAFSGYAHEQLCQARQALDAILARVKEGEPLRLWYSDNPNELCGFYHLMSQVSDNCSITAVKLPQTEQLADGTVVTHMTWGEIEPGQFHRYLPLEEPVSPEMRRFYRNSWQNLCQENAPVRAVLNGRLTGVGADAYDYFILRELEQQPEEFMEAILIGNILGKYQLGIGDWFIAQRIEVLIQSGRCTPTTQPPVGYPTYHRMLKKVQ